jgi:hypothetical protein
MSAFAWGKSKQKFPEFKREVLPKKGPFAVQMALFRCGTFVRCFNRRIQVSLQQCFDMKAWVFYIPLLKASFPVIMEIAVNKSGLSGCRVCNRDWPIENWRH